MRIFIFIVFLNVVDTCVVGIYVVHYLWPFAGWVVSLHCEEWSRLWFLRNKGRDSLRSGLEHLAHMTLCHIFRWSSSASLFLSPCVVLVLSEDLFLQWLRFMTAKAPEKGPLYFAGMNFLPSSCRMTLHLTFQFFRCDIEPPISAGDLKSTGRRRSIYEAVPWKDSCTSHGTNMAFARNLILLFLTLSLTSVLGTPVPDEEKSLAKRGTVLSGQWDTESEVFF